MGDDTLQNFFRRPIKTRSYNWATGDNLFETFNPWKDFWENPRVINRITNYNLLRCRLCVKFILNGNGFHYGRALASYIPLHIADSLTKDRSFFIQDIVEASQRPHIYLDPTNSLGGTMCLPFVYPHNAMDVPDAEWDNMGDIIIHGMQPLKHANGASDSVTVSIFVWAEDVIFSTPTANEPGALTPQAGIYSPQADEYGDGVISRPAAIVARAAGALTNAPAIGLYARATEIGANAVAAIASTFGFSRPAIVTDIQPYKPTYAGNLVNTNVGDTVQKLTLDAKQELTCDTRTFGLDGTDEMTIKSIATRESYLTNFSWVTASGPETLLWNTEVSPTAFAGLLVGGVINEYHMTACCFASLPFRYWRGTMKYRFQIVASAYHKGRLKISYDPSYPLTNEYNTNYTRVIDLAEERDFTVEIGWGQQTPYLEHRSLSDGEIYKTTPIGADPGPLANGILSVHVVNELTVPNSVVNNNIEINVFVSAGDDFEVAVPHEDNIREISWFQPQSGIFQPQAGPMDNIPDSDNTLEENAPMRSTVDESMVETGSTLVDRTNDVFMGDPVTSIRQILKRYCLSRVLSPTDPGYRLWRHQVLDLPLYRGFAPDGVDSGVRVVGAGVAPVNFVKQTFVGYFLPAYVCWRGNLRWKYMLTSNAANKSFMGVTNNVRAFGGYDTLNTVLPANNSPQSVQAAEWITNIFPGTMDGAIVNPPDNNPVVEAEIPFYRNSRFAYGKQGRLTDDPGYNSSWHMLNYIVDSTTTDSVGVLAYNSVGEDFTLGWYMGPPVAYLYSDPAPDTAP